MTKTTEKPLSTCLLFFAKSSQTKVFPWLCTLSRVIGSIRMEPGVAELKQTAQSGRDEPESSLGNTSKPGRLISVECCFQRRGISQPHSSQCGGRLAKTPRLKIKLQRKYYAAVKSSTGVQC